LEILQFFHADHVAMLRYDINKTFYPHIYLACADQIPPVPTTVDLPTALFPYMYNKLVKEGVVASFTTIEELPDEAATDRESYAKWGIRSCMNIPLGTITPYLYIISIISVRRGCVWPEVYIPRLQVPGELFVNVPELKRTRLQLMADVFANAIA